MAFYSHCGDCGEGTRKADTFTCAVCLKKFCPSHSFYYVDESNASITKNSRAHCASCYRQKYLVRLT